jgi:iron complex outermembrane receptor protein
MKSGEIVNNMIAENQSHRQPTLVHFRIPMLALTILFWGAPALLVPQNVVAQPTESPASDIQYLESIEEDNAEGGEDAVVDSMDLQAEQAEAGDSLSGVSRAREGRIEEIVVSARKRAELLEDTPVSITALGADVLRESGINRLDGIQELVPNLRIDSGINGNSTLIRIRGVGTSTAGVAFEPGVGLYVDGVFLPRALGSLMDLVDVAQIEVLRGPQGTLFGKNTVGGAINISTVKPQDELEAFAMVRSGNFGSVTTRGMVNIPIDIGWLEDRLFSRFSITTTNDRGYVYNETQDLYQSNRNSMAFLGSLRFQPIEDLTIDASGTWTREHNRNRGGRCTFVRETGLQSRGLEDACRASEPYVISANVPMLFDLRSYGAWGTADYQIGDIGPINDLSVKFLTSWREQRNRFRGDTDMTIEPTVERLGVGGEFASSGIPTNGGEGSARQISEELQINGSALNDRLNFVAGYFVFWENATEPTTTATDIKLRDVPASITRSTYATIGTDNSTWAVYSQATLDVTDWLSATAGLRYSEDLKKASLDQYDVASGGETFAGSGQQLFSRFTPMASVAATVPESYLDESPFDHIMGYFTYSQGFKGGGFNAVPGPRIDGQLAELPAFGPETLDNFEIGAKTVFLDQRMSANVSFFFGDYENIQVTSVKDLGILPGSDGVPTVVRITQNAAQATTTGLEFELLARPIDGMTVQGSVGVVDARYDDFRGAISDYDGSVINRSGESLPGIPQLQTFVSLQHSFPVRAAGAEMLDGYITPRLEWAYTSEIYYSGRELLQGRQGGVNLLNGRLSWDFLDDRAQVALWSKNMLNEKVIDYVTPLAATFGVAARFYRVPRTFGAELSYKF